MRDMMCFLRLCHRVIAMIIYRTGSETTQSTKQEMVNKPLRANADNFNKMQPIWLRKMQMVYSRSVNVNGPLRYKKATGTDLAHVAI